MVILDAVHYKAMRAETRDPATYTKRAIVYMDLSYFFLTEESAETLVSVTSESDIDVTPELLPFAPMAFKDDEAPVIEGSMSVLILNPISCSPDQAISYLNFYIQHLSAEEQYALTPSLNSPVRKINIDEYIQNINEQREDAVIRLESAAEINIAELQQDIEMYDLILQNADRDQWEISERSIANYRALEDQIVLPSQLDYFFFNYIDATTIYGQLSDRYVEGLSTLGEFLGALNQKAYMMYLEGE